MKKTIEITKQIRSNFIQLLDGLSLEQLSQTPDKFNNNLIWNFAHIIVTQQNLTYKLANMPSVVSAEWVEKYSKGTKPNDPVLQQEFDQLKQLSFSLLDQFEKDYNAKKFENFTTYKTSSGIVLNSVEYAMLYNMTHENLHYGFAMAIKKFI